VFLTEKRWPNAGHIVTGLWCQRPVSVGQPALRHTRLGFLTRHRVAMHLRVRSFIEGAQTLLIEHRRFTVHRQLLWWRQQLRNMRRAWWTNQTLGASGQPWPDASGHNKYALGAYWTWPDSAWPVSGHYEEHVRSSLNCARDVPVDCWRWTGEFWTRTCGTHPWVWHAVIEHWGCVWSTRPAHLIAPQEAQWRA
jgi:hypothetical protein